jgi:ribulose-phosphate 3-epimerase
MSPERFPPATPAVAPSILSADFSRLPEALAIVDPAREWLHCDVMDNHFVPNLTFGPIILQAVTRLSTAWRDVHLMIERPESLIPAFRRAGADSIIVHLEACADPGAVLGQIRSTGAAVGLALRPGTPLSRAERWLGEIHQLLVMTVEPGFGGQPFMEDMLPKVSAARAWREAHAPPSGSRWTGASTRSPPPAAARPAPTCSWPARRSTASPTRPGALRGHPGRGPGPKLIP